MALKKKQLELAVIVVMVVVVEESEIQPSDMDACSEVGSEAGEVFGRRPR